MDIGFIGIGNMGKHMSLRILQAGHNLTVHDEKKEAAAPLLEKGARWAGTPQQVAASCPIVIASLPTPRIVEQVVFSQNGLKSGWKRGDIFIDMSTNSPLTIRRIAEDARTMGVTVLDAPVSGGTGGAELGTLTIMVGGEAEALEKARPALEPMAQKIFHVGPVGCGNVAKLVNNLIGLACNSVTAEGFVLGAKAGINPQILYEILKTSTGNNWSLQQYPRTVFQRNFQPGFKVSLAYKDIGLALNLGKEFEVPLPIGDVVKDDLEQAIAAGFADQDVFSVIRNLEKAADIQV